MADDLDIILVVASEPIVYEKISANLVAIKKQFLKLRENDNIDGNLSWLAIEKESDEQTRVTRLFQDAWNKDLVNILVKTLCITLKEIYGNIPAEIIQLSQIFDI